jgi:hypothetical protein
MNANGQFIPPTLIFPRVRPKPELIAEAPIGLLLSITQVAG